MDGRIVSKFLHPGPGFGGSCFPKDTLALLKISQDAQAPSRIVQAVVEFNGDRKRSMSRRIIEACGGSVKRKVIAVLGMTFKPNTDDIREAPSLIIIPALQKAGAIVRAHDPKGMAEARRQLPDVEWCDDPDAAMAGASAVVILTEWNEYRNLELSKVRSLLREPVFIDFRNIYEPLEVQRTGLRYFGIGRMSAAVSAAKMGVSPAAPIPAESKE